jgi:DNA replicative helicase MCM subunit Mcm2 (Cdc46/Mcm family)
MTTGEVPEWTTEDTHPAPGAITVTWRTSPTRRRGASDDMIPELAMAVDGVVTADRTADRWLTDTSIRTIDPVEPAFAGVYLEYARQRPTPLSTEARKQLEKMNTATETAHDGADSTESSTRTVGTDTIERLAIASARLELAETVTPAHVETAAHLYDNMLHVD